MLAEIVKAVFAERNVHLLELEKLLAQVIETFAFEIFQALRYFVGTDAFGSQKLV